MSALSPRAGVLPPSLAAVAGESPRRVAKHLSALRTLAGALALDPAIAQVKSKEVLRPAPRSLTVAEYNGLVALPKLNPRRGRRDHAILRVLGECGLRRSELVELTYHDIEKAARRLPADRASTMVARGPCLRCTICCSCACNRRVVANGAIRCRITGSKQHSFDATRSQLLAVGPPTAELRGLSLREDHPTAPLAVVRARARRLA